MLSRLRSLIDKIRGAATTHEWRCPACSTDDHHVSNCPVIRQARAEAARELRSGPPNTSYSGDVQAHLSELDQAMTQYGDSTR